MTQWLKIIFTNICHQYKKSLVKNRGTIIFTIITAKFWSKQTMHRLKCNIKEKQTNEKEEEAGARPPRIYSTGVVQSRAVFDTCSWRQPWGMALLQVCGRFHPLPSGVYLGSERLDLLSSPILSSLSPCGSSLIFPIHTVQLDLRDQGLQDNEGCNPARRAPSAGPQTEPPPGLCERWLCRSSLPKIVRRHS